MASRITALLLALGALLLAAMQPARAEQPTREFEGAPFSVAAPKQIGVQLLPLEAQAGFAAAAVLPGNASGMDLLEFRWPKSDAACVLAVARTDPAANQWDQPPQTNLAVIAGDKKAQALALEGGAIAGFLTRVGVWCTSTDATGEMVFLLSFGEGPVDSRVLGFSVQPTGEVQAIETGVARTQYGWFDLTDLDDNGTYELITTRNLDGMNGGFTFHAVRAYDAATRTYQPQPDSFKPYFEKDLAWLNWVVETRAAIQANPEPYLTKSILGNVYVAVYGKAPFGFDSVIEVPSTFPGIEDVAAYNRERRAAFELVRNYRDELKAWLGGGAYPPTWKLPK